MPAHEVFRRVSALRRLGVIRRVGPLFSSRRLGFRAFLVAVRVTPDAVESLAELLRRRPEVTHNYLRDGRFNVWFTVLLAAGDDAERILGELRACPGVSEVRAFATRKVFKLDASFAVPGEAPSPSAPISLPQGETGESTPRRTLVMRMDETDRRIIASLEGGLPDSATPYEDVAGTLGLEVGELMSRLEAMRRSGVLRAMRAVLDQRRLGLEGNVLAAWAVPEARVDEVGGLFSRRREVSHCVLRECAGDWPYNLYTMIHAQTPVRARTVIRELVEASGVTEHVALETLKELKKVPPRYF
jgi:DNA-binding Lrp family transcriptional regulator